ITRARDEGILRALAATGGGITSAGILLAGGFAEVGGLPGVGLPHIRIVGRGRGVGGTPPGRPGLVPALVVQLGALVLGARRRAKRRESRARATEGINPRRLRNAS